MDREVIDTAFVSGRLGQAIYRVRDELYALTVDGTCRLASAADLHEVTSGGTEYQLVCGQTAEELQNELRRLVRNYNALFLVISLLDFDISLSTRIVAAQSAEELLDDGGDREFVTRRVLSVPLPVRVRSRRHEIVSPWAQFAHVKSLLSEVFELQSILDELWAGWRRAAEAQFIDDSKRSSLEASLISSGFFLDAARAAAAGDHRRFNSVVVQYAISPEVTGELKAAQSLLTTFRSEVHPQFFASAQRAVQRPLRLKRGEHSPPPKRAEDTDTITRLIQNYESVEKPRRHVGALESKARVDKQISAIRGVLFAGKNSVAEKYLEGLVAFQLGQGDREHAAMSLCALTAIALDANQFDMADRLSQYALKLTSDDKVVYTSRAEVLKRRGHFDAALKAYQEAIDRFRRDTWALNGFADVLKEKGLFEESIERYKETQKEFPDDPVAFNGEVGVLKVSGQRRIALSLAVKYAKRFEYDPVTRSTLGGCLASLGKYDEAVRQYRAAIGLDPSEVKIQIGYVYALRDSGKLDAALRYADTFIRKFPDTYPMLQVKATLLRIAGRLDDAEKLYQRLVELYPTYAPARVGIAAIRVLQKRAEEAREMLPDDGMESEFDWFGFRLRALSYASVGDLEKAAPRLSFSLKQCPWLRERSKAETALGFVELQRGEYGKCIGLLNNNLEKLDAVDQQIRFTFLAHAHAQRGAKDVASVLLGRLFSSKEPNLRTIRNTIASEYKLFTTEGQGFDYGQIRAGELSFAMAA